MFKRFQHTTPIFFIMPLLIAGFAFHSYSNGKTASFDKTSFNVITQSTGVASVYYDGDKAAEFTGHHLIGLKYPNALYQGFLAFHFDEMDTVLTKHSAVGRTTAKNNPGDKNTFQWISRKFSDTSQTSSDTITFTANDKSNRFLIHQIIESKKDSSHLIFITYVFEFIKPVGVADTFSNVKILFGYDGDIGTSLGGFSDDSSGYHEDDSTALAYIFDDSLHLFSGVGIIRKTANAVAGNHARLHQTANHEGMNDNNLDTLLYGLMNQPTFSNAFTRTDVSVYWAIDLGTIIPADTIRDTIRFVLVNGSTKDDLIQAAKGNKIVENATGTFLVHKVPSGIVLHQNYPNPFNPQTVIKYELDKEAHVSLKIYNMLGQEVRNLFVGKKPAGFHSAVWDGQDSRGNHVSSGIYVYRLQTDKIVQSRKMILLN